MGEQHETGRPLGLVHGRLGVDEAVGGAIVRRIGIDQRQGVRGIADRETALLEPVDGRRAVGNVVLGERMHEGTHSMSLGREQRVEPAPLYAAAAFRSS